MAKFRHIYIEMFGANVYFICCTRANYEKAIKREFNATAPSEKGGVYGTVEGYDRDGTIIDVIWVDSKYVTNPIVAHECLHVTYHILGRQGLWLTDSSEEAYAYLIQHLIAKIGKWTK